MIFRQLLSPTESRSELSGLSDPQPWLTQLFGGSDTTSGVNVTPESALTYAAVYAVITTLAQDVATLPLPTYRRLADGTREEARDLPVFNLLRKQANPEMSAFVWRELTMCHLLSRGNAYSEIGLDGAGRPIALWPIHPARVTVRRMADRSLGYHIDGGPVPVPSWRILHIRAFGTGDLGLSPIDLHRQGIGLGLAAELAAGALYGSGSVPGGLLKVKGKLQQPERDRVRADWERIHRGADRFGRLAILEGDADYSPISFTPEAAQFLESRKFQGEEVCRIYRCPPHKAGYLERATNNNIEHQGIDYLQTSLGHWLERIEQEIDRKVLALHLGEDLYCEHRVDAFLRGDTLSRYQAYVQARTGGFLTRNEIRSLENRAPIAGGDDADAPLNSNRTESKTEPTPAAED